MTSNSSEDNEATFSRLRSAINIGIWYIFMLRLSSYLTSWWVGETRELKLLSGSTRGRRLKFSCLRLSSLEVREGNLRIFHWKKKRRGRTLQSCKELVIWPTSEANPDPLCNVLRLLFRSLSLIGPWKRNAREIWIGLRIRRKSTILSCIVQPDLKLRRNFYFIYLFLFHFLIFFYILCFL